MWVVSGIAHVVNKSRKKRVFSRQLMVNPFVAFTQDCCTNVKSIRMLEMLQEMLCWSGFRKNWSDCWVLCLQMMYGPFREQMGQPCYGPRLGPVQGQPHMAPGVNYLPSQAVRPGDPYGCNPISYSAYPSSNGSLYPGPADIKNSPQPYYVSVFICSFIRLFIRLFCPLVHSIIHLCIPFIHLFSLLTVHSIFRSLIYL